ncbi:hypothetical protein J437_LFUL009116 [Ladona fulva]|uniref:D-isomer specific 2-hydroxyacid dehydrogenase NAD-binding domain-containing protein n=1 Tax=Ladona fulva TaxID=123851 RepID=A0A8K0K8W8_LADFU|nr:hypothetical protein J437_LFUL009116 [Ladona fulva]
MLKRLSTSRSELADADGAFFRRKLSKTTGCSRLFDTWVSTSPQWMLGMELRGSTVGIVGFGGIGQTIARRLQGFEIGKIIYCGHSPKKEGYFCLKL